MSSISGTYSKVTTDSISTDSVSGVGIDNAMIPLVRIGKGDRSLSVLSLSFKFQLVWLLMFCFRLHNSSKSIISGFTTFHHHDFSLQLLENKSTYKRR